MKRAQPVSEEEDPITMIPTESTDKIPNREKRRSWSEAE